MARVPEQPTRTASLRDRSRTREGRLLDRIGAPPERAANRSIHPEVGERERPCARLTARRGARIVAFEMSASADDPRARHLRGASSREILQGLWREDPLGIGDLCLVRLVRRALLLDATRTTTYAMARVAADAWRFDGGSVDEYLAGCVEQAIEELLDDDRNLDADGVPVDADSEPHYRFLADALELPPMLGRKACVIFNSMPIEQRRLMWAILVEGRTFAEHAAATGSTPEKVKQYFKEAAMLIGTLGLSGGPEREN